MIAFLAMPARRLPSAEQRVTLGKIATRSIQVEIERAQAQPEANHGLSQ